MTLSEKSAYLRGLMEGLKIDTDKGEGKLLSAIVDMLEDVSYAISDIEADAQAVSDELTAAAVTTMRMRTTRMWTSTTMTMSCMK